MTLATSGDKSIYSPWITFRCPCCRKKTDCPRSWLWLRALLNQSWTRACSSSIVTGGWRFWDKGHCPAWHCWLMGQCYLREDNIMIGVVQALNNTEKMVQVSPSTTTFIPCNTWRFFSMHTCLRYLHLSRVHNDWRWPYPILSSSKPGVSYYRDDS